MVSLALIGNSIRHAWRLRLPVVLVVLLLLAAVSLPQLTVGDGSPEGKVRLYLLYAGHLCLFALSLCAVCYSIWFENQERDHKVHYLLYSRPVSAKQILLCRIFSYLLMLSAIGLIYFIAMVWTAHQHIQSLDISNEAKRQLSQKLMEVRERIPLRPILEMDASSQRLEKKTQQVINLESGQAFPFQLNLSEQKSHPVLYGKLLSLNKIEKALGRVEINLEQRVIWMQDFSFIPGQIFRLNLPEKLSQYKNLELRLSQVNSENKALYMPLADPLCITHPAGSIWINILRASLMMSLLLFSLLTLGVFSAQVLSSQGSLLTLSLIYIVGSCKDAIRSVVFPMSPPMGFGAPPTELQISDTIYIMIWKPILWLVPDFQALNPMTELMNGEYISWTAFFHQGVSTLPFLLICAFYLFYFLPRQERCLEP